MARRRHLPEAYLERRRGLEAARRELDAARALIGGLDDGALPACGHLARAASALAWVSDSLGEDRLPERLPGPIAAAAELDVPGLSERELERWRGVLPAVLEHAEPPLLSAAEQPGDLDRAARVAHDLLQRSLLWSERELRRRFLPDRRLPRRIWVAGAVLLAAAALFVLLPGRHETSAPPPAAALAGRASQRSEVTLQDLADAKPEGAPWNAAGNVIVPPAPGGLLVRLGAASHGSTLEISLDNNDRYRLDFLTGQRVLASTSVGPDYDHGGLVVYRTEVPPAAVAAGFDAIRIVPVEGDGSCSVGHLRLLDDRDTSAAGPGDGDG